MVSANAGCALPNAGNLFETHDAVGLADGLRVSGAAASNVSASSQRHPGTYSIGRAEGARNGAEAAAPVGAAIATKANAVNAANHFMATAQSI